MPAVRVETLSGILFRTMSRTELTPSSADTTKAIRSQEGKQASARRGSASL